MSSRRSFWNAQRLSSLFIGQSREKAQFDELRRFWVFLSEFFHSIIQGKQSVIVRLYGDLQFIQVQPFRPGAVFK